MDGFEVLVAGLAIFIAIHFTSFTYDLRQSLVMRLGVKGHRLLHSALSVLGLYLIITGFANRPMVHVYDVQEWAIKAPLVLMPLAFIFMAGFLIKGDFLRITRHPMLLAIALFAIGHLFANGDLGSVMLFGSFLLWSLLSMPLVDAKFKKTSPDQAESHFAHSSIVPFMAILQGRAVSKQGGYAVLKAFVLGLLFYAVVAMAHPYFTGVPVVAIT